MNVEDGRITALIGESGAGKTVLSRTLSGLLSDEMELNSGEIVYKSSLISYRWIQQNRGRIIFYMPQNAAAALNPIVKIKKQLGEICHRDSQPVDIVLRSVLLSDTDRILNSYPFQLSGGECQRCLLAMALILSPQLLIMDEPLVSLDYENQRNFMELIQGIQHKRQMTIMFATHNLNLIKNLADYVYILQKGQIVEEGRFCDLADQPQHGYTKEIFSYF
jgi:ABC-type glutathione transport system ATPase component